MEKFEHLTKDDDIEEGTILELVAPFPCPSENGTVINPEGTLVLVTEDSKKGEEEIHIQWLTGKLVGKSAISKKSVYRR